MVVVAPTKRCAKKRQVATDTYPLSSDPMHNNTHPLSYRPLMKQGSRLGPVLQVKHRPPSEERLPAAARTVRTWCVREVAIQRTKTGIGQELGDLRKTREIQMRAVCWRLLTARHQDPQLMWVTCDYRWDYRSPNNNIIHSPRPVLQQ